MLQNDDLYVIPTYGYFYNLNILLYIFQNNDNMFK